MTGYSAKENAGNLAGTLSQIWDGKPIDRVRVTDGSSIIYGRRVAVHLLMQPIFLSRIQKNDILNEQGIMARFLIVHPEPMAGRRRYQEVEIDNAPEIKKYNEVISSFLDAQFPTKNGKGRELEPKPIDLQEDAKKAWIVFHDDCEKKIGKNGALYPIKAMVSKAPNQVLWIAGILHIIKTSQDRCINTHSSIDLEDILNSIRLVEFYIEEALRIISLSDAVGELHDAQLASNWLYSKYKKSFLKKDLYQYGPSCIRYAKKAKTVLQILEEHNHIIQTDANEWHLNDRLILNK